MATWNVETLNKKSVEEHELWQKDDMVIRRITGWRWGAWTVTTSDDNPPEFAFDSGPGADACNISEEWPDNVEEVELDSMDDGWYGDIIFPDDMDEEEQERLEELWDEDFYDGWEGDGWVNYDTECWVSGEVKIERLDDDQ